MTQVFKKLPSLADLATVVGKLVHDLHSVHQATGHQFEQIDISLQENAAITDTAIEELNLKVAFLMTMIRAKRPLNSGLADVNGNVQFEQVSALELYLQGGREQLIEKRAAAAAAFKAKLDAQTGGNAENLTTAPGTRPEGVSADDLDLDLPSKLITH